MGLDLRLLPLDMSGLHACGWHILSCERRSDLFAAIGEIEDHEGRKVTAKTWLAIGDEGETRWGMAEETPYGDKLRAIRARSLCGLQEHIDVRDNERNRAAWAYMAALDPETLVALYWH